VTGVVTVDGEPGLGVLVHLEPVGGIDVSNPTISEGEANEEGIFQISTYGGNDGAPPGEYVLTFKRFDRTVIRFGGGDPKDMFAGKFADPKTSQYKVEVGKEPVNLGTIELSTK
jgi:hypothetical protein